MIRETLILISAGALLAGCATAVPATRRVRDGMTEQQVISILGKPAGVTSPDPDEEVLHYSRYNPPAGWQEYFVVLRDGKVTEYGKTGNSSIRD